MLLNLLQFLPNLPYLNPIFDILKVPGQQGLEAPSIRRVTMTKNTKSAQALDLAALASTARVGGELPKATRTRNAEESALTPLVLDAIADGQVRSLDNIPHDVDDKDKCTTDSCNPMTGVVHQAADVRRVLSAGRVFREGDLGTGVSRRRAFGSGAVAQRSGERSGRWPEIARRVAGGIPLNASHSTQ